MNNQFLKTQFSAIFIAFFSAFALFGFNLKSTSIDQEEPQLISLYSAKNYIGQVKTIKGLVKKIIQHNGKIHHHLYLNLDKNFPDNPVTVYLELKDVERLGFDKRQYQNKTVYVTGKINRFKDENQVMRFAIQITDLSQIKLKKW